MRPVNLGVIGRLIRWVVRFGMVLCWSGWVVRGGGLGWPDRLLGMGSKEIAARGGIYRH